MDLDDLVSLAAFAFVKFPRFSRQSYDSAVRLRRQLLVERLFYED